jgi:D-amino-acid dehydrogenase
MSPHAAKSERPALRVVVVGGGVIGVCSAYWLARRGAAVTLLERDEIGRGASYGNAGLISPGHPPINRPGRVRQALRSLSDPLSPLYVEPRWDPSLLRWVWTFRRYCTEEHVEHSMRSLSPLGLATSDLMDELVRAERLDCGYRRSGYLEVFDTEQGLAAGQAEAAVVARHGFDPEYLDADGLREREPCLSTGVVGGWFHPEGTVVHPYRFVVELADRATRRGARLHSRTAAREVVTERGRVRGVRTAAGELVEGDAVVLATGAYSPGLMAALGCPLPVQPAKGYHSDRDPGAGAPDLEVPCLLGESAVFCSPIDGFVRLAGTLEFSGRNHDIRLARLHQLDAAARRYFDRTGSGEPLSEWCGLRPCTPDGLPVIGPVPGVLGAYVATGHAMLGLTLGPVTGMLIADLVVDGVAGLPTGAFRADRFGRGETAGVT